MHGCSDVYTFISLQSLNAQMILFCPIDIQIFVTLGSQGKTTIVAGAKQRACTYGQDYLEPHFVIRIHTEVLVRKILLVLDLFKNIQHK